MAPSLPNDPFSSAFAAMHDGCSARCARLTAMRWHWRRGTIPTGGDLDAMFDGHTMLHHAAWMGTPNWSRRYSSAEPTPTRWRMR